MLHSYYYTKSNQLQMPAHDRRKLYRIVWFRIWRRFHNSLSLRVSNSGQPVPYARHFCTKNTGYKIYHCLPEISTRHYILLHNPTTLHMKTFFAPACHQRKKISSDKNCHILHYYTHARFSHHFPLLKIPSSRMIFLLVETQTSQFNQNKSIKKIESKNLTFSFFRAEVSVRVQ